MTILDTYSKRKKQSETTENDVYQYNVLPSGLRVQITNLVTYLANGIGYFKPGYDDKLSEGIWELLCHEFGVTELVVTFANTKHEALFEFIKQSNDIDRCLDAIELVFRCLEFTYQDYTDSSYSKYLQEQIKELNIRFLDHGVGYQYENQRIIKIDNTFIHSKSVKPALVLLTDPLYKQAESEFLAAYEHFRNHKNEDAISNAGKALESAMKVICKKRGWAYSETDPAKKLIDVCLTNNLIDPMMQSFWGGLRTILESGVPTIRNKKASHGAGASPHAVPDYLVSYVLHMTASNIVMLVNAEKALP